MTIVPRKEFTKVIWFFWIHETLLVIQYEYLEVVSRFINVSSTRNYSSKKGFVVLRERHDYCTELKHDLAERHQVM